MKVYIILAQPKNDCHGASIVGVYRTEASAEFAADRLNARAKARLNSASRHWMYEVVEMEVEP